MTTTKTSVGPTVSELKEQFMARSIPLEADFSDLIDIADVGRKAVGQSPEQTPNPTSGLILGTNGQQKVQLKPEAGLMVDSSGVGLVPEQQLSRGMIMMFSGSTVPVGWALCSGDNGTPDLRNRFVLGGSLGDNGRSSSVVSGIGNNKSYNVTSNTKQPSVSVSVESHKLTTSQIPSHRHLQGERYVQWGSVLNAGANYGWKSKDYTSGGARYEPSQMLRDGWGEGQLYSQSIGGGQGHKHNATASQASHSHSTNVIVPYYTLAFIMKL
ncbi:hypothetical protein AB4175_10505 [Vibrio cyclitrophicus]